MITVNTKNVPATAAARVMYYEYMGLSSDTKPTGDNVADNSIFVELDTGDIYYKTGDEWVEFGEAAASSDEVS